MMEAGMFSTDEERFVLERFKKADAYCVAHWVRFNRWMCSWDAPVVVRSISKHLYEKSGTYDRLYLFGDECGGMCVRGHVCVIDEVFNKKGRMFAPRRVVVQWFWNHRDSMFCMKMTNVATMRGWVLHSEEIDPSRIEERVPEIVGMFWEGLKSSMS